MDVEVIFVVVVVGVLVMLVVSAGVAQEMALIFLVVLEFVVLITGG